MVILSIYNVVRMWFEVRNLVRCVDGKFGKAVEMASRRLYRGKKY
jgi:hypothetical protein